jgi:integrase/recombinase XerD
MSLSAMDLAMSACGSSDLLPRIRVCLRLLIIIRRTLSFTVTEKLDLGWSPKDREEGAIPIPDSLLEILRARRKLYPGTRLIFPGANGKADRHFLRTLKRLALQAGLNCGHCYNKAGQCCAKRPVCKRFELYRFRKTFATMHHEAGVPARTIQRWLRHSSLDTTLAYLAASDDLSERTRDRSTAPSLRLPG